MSALFDDTAYAVKLTQVEQFVAPPTSVLDAASGYWQDRRRAWCGDFPQLLGSEGRADVGVGGFGHLASSTDDTSRRMASVGEAATVFDPVLAEVAYSWWTAPGFSVFDPFAGGPARGVVAAAMGRSYLGVDIREEQVDHNENVGIPGARWVCANAAAYRPADDFDFVFSCPPYGSLEVYSDNPNDLSTMSWETFRGSYKMAIDNAVSRLRDDRFAAFVVGNYKERGTLRDLAGLTVEAFGEAGADYFGDIVFVPPSGSAALRAQASFPVNRRPMPRHQLLLVFVKGDRRKAADAVKVEAA